MSLELIHVSHSYGRGRPPVVRDVSLAVAGGETVALMGSSGSGKTTLLTILGLLTKPTAGHIYLDGDPIAADRPDADALRSSCFAWVFQTANALGRRSALDNAMLGLLTRGRRHQDARSEARAALDAVGIGDLAWREARSLSGGELQRVCIARALAVRPRFLLADEPTGQLDHATTLGVVQALLDNRPAGTAVIIATHDAEVAARCARILRIVDGRIEAGR
ncbi:MAG: ABC transporter ATP-binding protein [Tepidiformaceae bacterium]